MAEMFRDCVAMRLDSQQHHLDEHDQGELKHQLGLLPPLAHESLRSLDLYVQNKRNHQPASRECKC